MCCISACLAYWAAMRPKPAGVTSTSISSPTWASGLIRRASNTEIWSCLEMTFSETISLAKARISPFFGSMAHAQFARRTDRLFGSRQQRLLDSADQDITADALFAFPKFQYC